MKQKVCCNLKNFGHYFTVSIGQQSNVLVNCDKAFHNENLCLKFFVRMFICGLNLTSEIKYSVITDNYMLCTSIQLVMCNLFLVQSHIFRLAGTTEEYNIDHSNI